LFLLLILDFFRSQPSENLFFPRSFLLSSQATFECIFLPCGVLSILPGSRPSIGAAVRALVSLTPYQASSVCLHFQPNPFIFPHTAFPISDPLPTLRVPQSFVSPFFFFSRGLPPSVGNPPFFTSKLKTVPVCKNALFRRVPPGIFHKTLCSYRFPLVNQSFRPGRWLRLWVVSQHFPASVVSLPSTSRVFSCFSHDDELYPHLLPRLMPLLSHLMYS